MSAILKPGARNNVRVSNLGTNPGQTDAGTGDPIHASRYRSPNRNFVFCQDSHRLSFFYFIADVDQAVHETSLGTVNDAFLAVAGNQSGYTRIGNSRSLPEDASQLMAPFRFNDGIDIDTSREPWA